MKPTLILPLAVLVTGGMLAGAVSAQDESPDCQPRPFKSACVIWQQHQIDGLNLASQPVQIVVAEKRETFDGTEQGWVIAARQRDGSVIVIDAYGPVTGDLAAGELGDILPVIPATGGE